MALVAVYVFSQPNSCITMGIMDKINGLVAPSNRILALSCALLLIITPVSFADYEAGVNAAFNGDFETALHEFTIAAEEGLDLAQYNLGILYFTGQGVDKDLAEAFRWTEAAALQGHVAAQFNLGSLYYAGDGVGVDQEKAVELFESAARAGHGNSALLLANMYADGDLSMEELGFVARLSKAISGLFSGDQRSDDLVLAHAWSSIALANESLEAEALRASLETRMSTEQLQQARRQYAIWQLE